MTKKSRFHSCPECGCVAKGSCAETRADEMEKVLQQIADIDIGSSITVAQDLIETSLGIQSTEESE